MERLTKTEKMMSIPFYSLRRDIEKKNKAYVTGILTNRLGRYEDREENGQLMIFACAVGDTVYYPDESMACVLPIRISQITVSDIGQGKRCIQYSGCFFDQHGDPEEEFEFEEDDFGRNVFFNEEEADTKLSDMLLKSGQS